ncbi:MAG: ParA family protein [bacterium]
MPVYSVANQKGGVGKTNTAINLAGSLAEKGARILVVDLDPQGNATVSLGANRHEIFISVYEVLIEGANVRSAILPTVQDNLFLLPANDNLPGAEIELVEKPDRSMQLKYALKEIDSEFDYILIDCPPSLGILTLNGLVASDGIIVPMQAEFLALEGLTQLLKTIDLVTERLNPALILAGVLITMYDARTNLTKEVENEVREFFTGKTKVFDTIIPRSVRLAEAPSHGLPINLYAPSSPGAIAFRNLAEEVIDVTQSRFGKGLESAYIRGESGENASDSAAETGDGIEMGEGDTAFRDQTESGPTAQDFP